MESRPGTGKLSNTSTGKRDLRKNIINSKTIANGKLGYKIP